MKLFENNHTVIPHKGKSEEYIEHIEYVHKKVAQGEYMRAVRNERTFEQGEASTTVA